MMKFSFSASFRLTPSHLVSDIQGWNHIERFLGMWAQEIYVTWGTSKLRLENKATI